MRDAGVEHFEVEKIYQLAEPFFFELEFVGRINRNAVNQTLLQRRDAAGDATREIEKLHILAWRQSRRILELATLVGAGQAR